MVAATPIAEKQKEKDRCQAMEESTLSRIHSLRDTKRDLVIRLASSEISTNKTLPDVLLKEIAEIESEIYHNEEKITSMQGTPIKNMTTRADQFSFIYNQPGTYKVTFDAFNINVYGESRSVRDVELTINP